MRLTRRLAIVVAIVCGALAALLTYLYLSGLQQPTQPTETAKMVAVITPVEDIEAGTLIQGDMLTEVEVPAEQAPSDAAKSRSQLAGKLARVDLPTGEPILTGQVRTTEGLLSYRVPEGMRAVTVAIDPIVGVAGFPQPGDRVDVIATFNLEKLDVTRTVLQNVQLLAVGQVTVTEVEKEQARDEEGEIKPEPERTTATLAVTPEQAQILVLSDERGQLRLALRPRRDEHYIAIAPTDSSAVIGEMFEELASAEAEPPPEPTGAPPYPAGLAREPTGPTVEVIRGTTREMVVIGDGRTNSSAQRGAGR